VDGDIMSIVSDSDIVAFLESMKGEFVPVFEEQVKQFGHHVHSASPVEVSDYKGHVFSKKVKKVYMLDGSFSLTNNIGRSMDRELFEASDFGISIMVIITDTQVFIMYNSIQLPIAFRSKGIFTRTIKTIKEFLVRHSLGDIIGLSDASDGGSSTSDIANKYGILCDPFLPEHHQLEEVCESE
jgi:hypothetical protein